MGALSSPSSSLTCLPGFSCHGSAHPPCLPPSASLWIRRHQSPSLHAFHKYGGKQRIKMDIIATANAGSSEKSSSLSRVAPFRPRSPTGQVLLNLLQNHPHLVSAAAEHQLNKLVEDQDSALQQHEQYSAIGADIVLYRRIAELKLEERRNTLEEIMYALIAQKFMAANIPMVTQIQTFSSEAHLLDAWPLHEMRCRSVHSPEALEMVVEHAALVMGGRDAVNYIDACVMAELSKVRIGQVYAGSIVYGYFVKKMDQRFQLEKSLKALPQQGASESGQGSCKRETAAVEQYDLAGEAAAVIAKAGERRSKVGMKPSKLRAYIQSLGTETLKEHAKTGSKESMHVIEKQTEALFGRLEVQTTRRDSCVTSAKDEVVKLSFGGLKRLILEAVVFGSFLWDVELQVDSHHSFE